MLAAAQRLLSENAPMQETRKARIHVASQILVPGGGIEPPQAFWALRILSPLRLPISPSRRARFTIVTVYRNCTVFRGVYL